MRRFVISLLKSTFVYFTLLDIKNEIKSGGWGLA